MEGPWDSPKEVRENNLPNELPRISPSFVALIYKNVNAYLITS